MSNDQEGGHDGAVMSNDPEGGHDDGGEDAEDCQVCGASVPEMQAHQTAKATEHKILEELRALASDLDDLKDEVQAVRELVEDDHHDPHFEPIIPMPEIVRFPTGEEDEEVLFKHTSKVFRYDPDTKQWKKRGVGDLKILHHPGRNTCRVLLRRDQVHKVACNHLITKDMELKPMHGSETAVCYVAMDYAEEEKGRLEVLAVKFKVSETKDQFRDKFEEWQRKLLEADQENIIFESECEHFRYDPNADQWKERGVGDLEIRKHPTRGTYRVLLWCDQVHKIACNHLITKDMELKPMNGSETAVCYFAMDYAEKEPKLEQLAVKFKLSETEDQFRDKFEESQRKLLEDDEDHIIFECECELVKVMEGTGEKCSLRQVELRVVRSDNYGARIAVFSNRGDMKCSHLIAMQTQLEAKEGSLECSWSATDFSREPPSWCSFTAIFRSASDAAKFRDTFNEGKELAKGRFRHSRHSRHTPGQGQDYQ